MCGSPATPNPASEDPQTASEREEDVSTRAALAAADVDNLKEMHANFYALASGSLERSKFAAETIQKASAAIAALYAGILGLVFSVSENALPLRGILAPVFLGAAVVLASVYLTYIVVPPKLEVAWDIARTGHEQRAFARLDSFMAEARGIVDRQIGLLGMALAALFVGLACIALPFVGVPSAFSPPTAESQVQKEIPWPSLDAAAAGESQPALAVELYKQQVAEVAALRAEARKPAPAGAEPAAFTATLLILGIAITFGGWLLPLKPKHGEDDDQRPARGSKAS